MGIGKGKCGLAIRRDSEFEAVWISRTSVTGSTEMSFSTSTSHDSLFLSVIREGVELARPAKGDPHGAGSVVRVPAVVRRSVASGFGAGRLCSAGALTLCHDSTRSRPDRGVPI